MPPPFRIGVVTHPAPDLNAPYFTACLEGLEVLFGKPSLSLNPRSPMDGWILLAPRPAQMEEFRSVEAPRVIVNGSAAGLPSIDVDNVGAARAVTSHLVRRGHRRIGFIAGKSETSNARDRREGYRHALEQNGIPWDEAFLVEGRFERVGGRRGMENLLNLASPPTAVFAANDHMALGAWDILREKGIPVPGGMALAGFDDIPEAERVGLTSVRQPLAEMAKQAGAWLLRWIETGRQPDIGGTLVPGVLVVRGSSGKTANK